MTVLSRIGVLALTVTLSLPVLTLAQDEAGDKPDMSGTWNHPSFRTDGDLSPDAWAMRIDSNPPRLVIEQTETELRVTGRRGVDTEESTFVYRLDGSESINESAHYRDHRDTHASTARWVGWAVLVTTVTTHGNDGTQTESIETYSLDASRDLDFTTFSSSSRLADVTNMNTTRYSEARDAD